MKATRNIAYHGGPTNGLMNYLETPANAYQDIVDWNVKVHALGYKSVVSTMISRCGLGSHGKTGDQLKQEFNALLLANADLFDWVSNQAASPQIGADNACANPKYFSDASSGLGTHLTNAGQLYYVAAERAGFEGAYSLPSTTISGPYTQLPSDLNIQAAGSEPYTVTLMDANTANFNSKGILCVNNVGDGNVVLAASEGQTIDGSRTVSLTPGTIQCIRPVVLDATVAGAVWVTAPDPNVSAHRRH